MRLRTTFDTSLPDFRLAEPLYTNCYANALRKGVFLTVHLS